ncbi:MAG: glycosyltransferase family 2 protein [Panacibacter sp.]
MNNANQSVAVVVVTYNRLELLRECLDSLRNQSRKPESIIIVNNASIDGTTAWLKTQEDIIVIDRVLNEGSAGGFYFGMKYATDHNYDWIWVMDDDAAPHADCLEKMLNTHNEKDVLTVLAPLVKEGDTLITNHRSNFYIKPDLSGFQQPLGQGKELQPQVIEFASFVGFMISKKLINKCGLPDKDLFFQNDDVEYCLRINKYGRILLVPSAIIEHKFVKKDLEVKSKKIGGIKTNDFTLPLLFVKFFVQRNKILIKEKYFKENFSLKLLVFRINVLLNYCKNLFKILLFVPFKYKKVYFNVYAEAYNQGLTGRFNNDNVLKMINDARRKEAV